MLISFIQMGHLQSVRDWIKNIKYCKAAQDLNQKMTSQLCIHRRKHQFNASTLPSFLRYVDPTLFFFCLVTSLNEAISEL